MPFNLLLLPLLGGFIFFSHWNRTAFFAKRQDSERLLLYSSLWGVLFLGISFLLSIVSPYSGLLSALRHWWAYHTPPIEFSGISSCALLLGVGGQYLLNNIWPFSRIWNQKKQGERSIEIYGSQLEKLLYRSIVENKRVMVTLKNEKFYIGRVAISLTPQQDRDLLILPSQSGYRDHKHRVMLTTDYDQTYRVILTGLLRRRRRIISILFPTLGWLFRFLKSLLRAYTTQIYMLSILCMKTRQIPPQRNYPLPKKP